MGMRDSFEEPSELRIPVPWGHVAGKTWGNKENPVVLCFHGIMDNASSFDRLMEYLPRSYYYVSVDFPGHGRSSHFPPKLPIHSIDYLLVYRILAKYFKRQSYTIMGHSYGGQLGLMFAQVYPEYVNKIIMFDTITLIPVSSKNFGDYLSDKLESYFDIQEKLQVKKQPTYTFDEALNRLMHGRNYAPLNEAAARALIERSIEPTDDGRYRFTLDPRLKSSINPLRDIHYVIESFKAYPVKCPLLIMLAKDSSMQQIYLKPVIHFMERWKNASIKYVEGHHDVHNTHPDRVAQTVVDFLIKGKAKL